MNVRLSSDSIRFRISTDELETVLRTRTLAGATPLPPDGQQLRYEVMVGTFPAPLRLAHADGKMTLLVSRKALSDLAEMLPLREGLSGFENVGSSSLKISLEIDIKKDR